MLTWVDDAAGWQPVTAVGFGPGWAGDDRYAIYVWRSEREGGDTKTDKSRRTLELPQRCVEALRAHQEQQERDRLRAAAELVCRQAELATSSAARSSSRCSSWP